MCLCVCVCVFVYVVSNLARTNKKLQNKTIILTSVKLELESKLWTSQTSSKKI